MVDAPPDSPPPPCPSSYDITLDGQTSKYQIVLVSRTWFRHEETCAADLPGGRTHLVTFPTPAEQLAIRNLVLAQSVEREYFIGLAQLNGASTPSSDWTWIDGAGPPAATVWLLGEPQDSSSADEDGEQNHGVIDTAAIISSNPGIVEDRTFNMGIAAICECDAP